MTWCLHIELASQVQLSTHQCFVPDLYILVGARLIVQSSSVSAPAPPSQPCDAAALIARYAAKSTSTARKSVY